MRQNTDRKHNNALNEIDRNDQALAVALINDRTAEWREKHESFNNRKYDKKLYRA